MEKFIYQTRQINKIVNQDGTITHRVGDIQTVTYNYQITLDKFIVNDKYLPIVIIDKDFIYQLRKTRINTYSTSILKQHLKADLFKVDNRMILEHVLKYGKDYKA